MDENIIKKVSRFSNKTDKRRNLISFLGTISPYTVFVLYIGTAMYVIIDLKCSCPQFFIIPAISFASVSIIRSALNKKRPFELYGIPKLIPHGGGKSFPSRHSACCISISLAIFTVSRTFGVIAFICSAVICVTRVLCGVHFIKDVLAGVFMGGIFWVIYFIFQAVR